MKINEIKLNGQTFEMKREIAYSLCQCGHIQLGHVHYNGSYGECPCNDFRARKYQTTEGEKSDFERKFERIINLFCLVEMKFGYILPSDFSDEFISAVKEVRDHCKALQEDEI